MLSHLARHIICVTVLRAPSFVVFYLPARASAANSGSPPFPHVSFPPVPKRLRPLGLACVIASKEAVMKDHARNYIMTG
uniref:Putative secreted protein n=1 Tax=Amblyomma cajennense TaxID=34607 RepID=A0A023FB82_AMBCJ